MRKKFFSKALLLFFYLLLFTVISGCSSSEKRYDMLSFFFDGVPPPEKKKEQEKADDSKGTIRSRGGGNEKFRDWLARIVPIPLIKSKEKDVQTQAATTPTPTPDAKGIRPPVEELTTYEEVLALLPKDSMGQIHWMKALTDKAIQPKASLYPESPDLPILDLDVELIPKDQSTFKVVYPHSSHTRWLSCNNCHPSIFIMQKGADPITMGKIFAGEYCGRCHGKVAFDVTTNCDRCHPLLSGGG